MKMSKPSAFWINELQSNQRGIIIGQYHTPILLNGNVLSPPYLSIILHSMNRSRISNFKFLFFSQFENIQMEFYWDLRILLDVLKLVLYYFKIARQFCYFFNICIFFYSKVWLVLNIFFRRGHFVFLLFTTSQIK